MLLECEKFPRELPLERTGTARRLHAESKMIAQSRQARAGARMLHHAGMTDGWTYRDVPVEVDAERTAGCAAASARSARRSSSVGETGAAR
jgi:hypothetical protein